MKTELDVITAVDALKKIIDKLMADLIADLNDIEKKHEANQDDIWMYEELEYDIKCLSHQISIKKERLKALEWVLDN